MGWGENWPRYNVTALYLPTYGVSGIMGISWVHMHIIHLMRYPWPIKIAIMREGSQCWQLYSTHAQEQYPSMHNGTHCLASSTRYLVTWSSPWNSFEIGHGKFITVTSHGCHCVSYIQRLQCLLNRLLYVNTPKLRIIGSLWVESPGDQWVNNAVWCCHNIDRDIPKTLNLAASSLCEILQFDVKTASTHLVCTDLH